MGAALEVREWILGWDRFSPQVRQQILTMTVMFVGGLVIGFLRTVDLWTVKRWKTGAVTGWILEVMFWILAGFCASEFLYYCAYGALSFHGFAAMVLGFYAWKRLICREIVIFPREGAYRQNLTKWGIIKGNVISGETFGENAHGKDETKPLVQKRTRKQRHQHR